MTTAIAAIAPADVAAAIRALSPHQRRVLIATETNAADRKLRTPSRPTRDAMIRVGVVEHTEQGLRTTTLGDAVGAALVAHGIDAAADAVENTAPAAPADPNGPADIPADQLRRGDLIATDRTGGIVAAVVETDAHGFISVRPFDGYGGIAEHPYRYLTSETVHVHRRGLVDGPMVDGRPVGPALTVPMPAAQPGECPDCLAPEGECNAATCPAYASDDAPLPAALLPDAPLGTIRFYEGSEDAPQCPCGNDVQGDGFRYVTVATSVDGPVGVFIEADGAWHALGRHVACVADHCLRVWSDRDIVRDGTGVWAPVTMRLHHLAEATTA